MPLFSTLQTDNLPDLEIVSDSVRMAEFQQVVDKIAHTPFQQTLNTLWQWAAHFGLKIVGAVAIFLVGRWLIRKVVRGLEGLFERRRVDPSLRSFLLGLVQAFMAIVLILGIISVFGIKSTSLIALFGAAGLAVGMALSGTLQNFAGGVMVLLLKPYRIGDYIEAQGQAGTVKDIRLFNTVLNTPDNKTILIPNGGISTGIINNYTTEPKRRVEWTFDIGYGDSYDHAYDVLVDILKSDERVLKTPAFFIALNSLGTNSVNILVRVWVPSELYWDVYFDMNELVYKRFSAEGINFPYPQVDVHLVEPHPGAEEAAPNTKERIVMHRVNSDSNQSATTKNAQAGKEPDDTYKNAGIHCAKGAQKAPGDGSAGGRN